MLKSQTANREPEIFGYIRVSMKEQNIDRQLTALEQYHIPPDNIFIDKKSGKDFNRPKYKRLFPLPPYIPRMDKYGLA